MNLLSSFFLCVVFVATLVSGNLPPGIERHPDGGWTQVILDPRDNLPINGYIWALDYVRRNRDTVIIVLQAPPPADAEMQQFLEQHVASRYVEIEVNDLFHETTELEKHLLVSTIHV